MNDINKCPFCDSDRVHKTDHCHKYKITQYNCRACFTMFKTNSEGVIIIKNGTPFKRSISERESPKLASIVNSLQCMKEEMQSQARSLKYMLKNYDVVLNESSKKKLECSLKKAEQMIKDYENLGEDNYSLWSEAWEKEGQPHY